MAEIRRLSADECTTAKKIGTVVFHGRHDYTQEERPDAIEQPHHWRWGAFEGGRMVSTMTDIPLLMRFDGNDVKMNGISFVGTLPEFRKGGNVRRMLEMAFVEAYADGVVFSCLIPFSHAFYRKFGYELCVTRKRTRIPVSNFEKLKYSGSFEQIFSDGDTAGLRRVFMDYISDKNHACGRDYWPDNIAWRVFTNVDPFKTGCYIYLWRDDAGNPRCYLKYQHKFIAEKSVNEVNVQEFAFTDREALYAGLAFIGSLSAQIQEMVWDMPSFIDPSDFADVAWDAEQEIIPREMTRIVNVKAAFEKMRMPRGEGSFVVETEDPILPENGGRLLVEFGAGGRRVSATGMDADIVCDLPALAQLVTGYRTYDDIRITSRLRVETRGNEDTLRRVFTPRPQHFTERV